MSRSGYSDTPLVRKLGIKPGMRLLPQHAPRDYAQIVPDLPPDVEILRDADRADVVHLFVTESDGLQQQLARYRELIRPAGMVWVSWPRKSARVPTDVTEDVVRDAALAAGLVDTKVCAVDDVWSGLKLVIRLADC